MTSYYKKLIRDYAKVAKPLIYLTSGENEQSRASVSRKVSISLTEEALQPFSDLKNLVMSLEVLPFPDFKQPFKLTPS